MSASFERVEDLVREGAARFPRETAVQRCKAAGGTCLTHAGLHAAVESAAASLRAKGLPPGERVVLALPGSPEWAVAFFAILRAGLVAVPVVSDTPAPALEAIVARSRAAAVVGSRRAGALAVETLLARARALAPLADRANEPLALLAFTSGSTGEPRAVELTHANLLANLAALLGARRAAPGDAFLSMLPPAHLFELMAGLLAPLACGARIVYAGAPLVNRLVQSAREDGITHVLTVPALLAALCREVGSENVRERLGPTLRVVCVGGAALDPRLARLVARAGIDVEVGYGLSEASPIVSLGLAAECPPGSVGRALAGVDVRLDARGEILVRGPSVMRGYWRDPAATAQVLHDGWLSTGDLGRIDEQGFLFVTGRLKELMVTDAGETLHPEELEPWYASPLFAEHCIVPVRGPHGNDVPTLVIVLAQRELPEEELQRAFAHLRAAAPPRCRVAGLVRHAAPLPRTALGKLRRRVLAEELAAGRKEDR